MRRSSRYWIPVLSVIALLLTGCVAPPSHYDYTALENSRPRSILVIPPANNSIEANASYIFLATISRPLAEKGYYVFPVAVIDHFLKENGLPTPAEMNGIPLDKIEEHIGADAVLYVSIEDWGQKYLVVTSKTVVHSTLRLVDVKTGNLLWEKTVRASQASEDGGLGPLGAIVIALAVQAATAISDNTHQLSSSANYSAIHNKSNGLLHGPYFNPDGATERIPVKAHNAPAEEADLLFMGKAAGEIAAKSYDENLWRQSGELAGGDAQKQADIYIKLRAIKIRAKYFSDIEKRKKAEEIARQNAELANQQGQQPIEILGIYNSVVKSNKGRKSNPVVILAQSGNELQGKFIPDNGDRVSGTIQDGKIRFHWIFADGTYDRKGVWKIQDAKKNRLEGAWENEGNTNGTWKLTKLEPGSDKDIEGLTFASTPNTLQLAGIDLSGTYISDITSSSPKTLPQWYRNLKITLKRNGSTITGADRSGKVQIRGIQESDTIKFYMLPNEITGFNESTGIWIISADGSSAEGTWKIKGGRQTSGKWDLTRIE